MPTNARSLLEKWSREQHRIARQSGAMNHTEIDAAEARMVVIDSLLNWVNPSAVLSDAKDGEQQELQNNQAQTLWTSICSIARMRTDASANSWLDTHLKEIRTEVLAATVNSCRG